MGIATGTAIIWSEFRLQTFIVTTYLKAGQLVPSVGDPVFENIGHQPFPRKRQQSIRVAQSNVLEAS